MKSPHIGKEHIHPLDFAEDCCPDSALTSAKHYKASVSIYSKSIFAHNFNPS